MTGLRRGVYFPERRCPIRNDDVITTAEAARVLGVSARRVQQFVAAGRLPALPFGRAYLLSRAAVLRFAALDRPAHRPRKIPHNPRETA